MLDSPLAEERRESGERERAAVGKKEKRGERRKREGRGRDEKRDERREEKREVGRKRGMWAAPSPPTKALGSLFDARQIHCTLDEHLEMTAVSHIGGDCHGHFGNPLFR